LVPLPVRNLLAPVRVLIGGVEAEVTFAGAAPFLVLGVVQVNARVPSSLPPGNASLQVIIGGVSSQPGMTVAVL
jgi:uncharacterized protein (TIGR03437 family)